jgi:hypothetical protein
MPLHKSQNNQRSCFGQAVLFHLGTRRLCASYGQNRTLRGASEGAFLGSLTAKFLRSHTVPGLNARVPIECGLKCGLQCALVARGQRNKPERLLGGGDREEHDSFGRIEQFERFT